MITNNPKDLPLAIYALLFHREEVVFKGNKLKVKTTHLRTGGTVNKVEVGSFLYIEQNKYKRSKWARMARYDHNIMWIIHKETGEYWGRVVDGKVTQLHFKEALAKQG